MKPYILSENNWKNINKSSYELAILPWGATEAHNYHLPYATDNIQSDYISIESARKAWDKGAKVVVLPCVPFGVNTGQIDIKLCINMNQSTQLALLKDVTDSLCRQGILKLVIINSHGGNNFRQIIREVQFYNPKILITVIDWYKAIDNNKYFEEPGDHAGEMETSNMFVIAPELVAPLNEAGEGKEKKFKITGLREGWVWTERKWNKISEDTGVGNPKKATAEKGKIFLEDLTNRIADFLVEFEKCDSDDIYE